VLDAGNVRHGWMPAEPGRYGLGSWGPQQFQTDFG
jgi:hypothetical protein